MADLTKIERALQQTLEAIAVWADKDAALEALEELAEELTDGWEESPSSVRTMEEGGYGSWDRGVVVEQRRGSRVFFTVQARWGATQTDFPPTPTRRRR